VQKLKNILIVSLLSLIILNPVLVLAQTKIDKIENTSKAFNNPQYTLSVDKSISQYLCTPSDPPDGKDLENCINKLYRFGISFGAIALVFFLVYAGYMYMTGGEAGKNSAKGIFQNALIGMVILLSSYVLLGFINPNLLLFKTIQPPIFTADNFPSCTDVGFGEKCTLLDGSVGTGNGTGGGIAEGDGVITGKKFVLVGDSLTPKFIGPLFSYITAQKGTLVAYSIGGTIVSDWVNGGVKKPCGAKTSLYNTHQVQKQVPCSPTTKMSDIVAKEKPDVIIVVLNTNRDNTYKTSIPTLVSQASGKIVYWVGTPQYEACTNVSDAYIRDANATAASAVGKNFYDTYKNLPGLNKGCDVHNENSKTWSDAFWEFYKKSGK
jgi:hypothetical protein